MRSRQRPGAQLLKKARKAAGLDPHGAATAVSALVADRVTYLPGVTTVNTSAAEAWEQGAGVCREAELHRPGGAGQSHAWVEYWAGDWYGYDPTNRTRADESHVVAGRGRDHDDVTSRKGFHRGVAGGPPEVTAEFTRVA